MEPTLEQMERRSAPRRRMSVPVRFPRGTGVTQDVSVAGVCFLSESSFEEGQQVSLTITLEHADFGHQIQLICRGRVVRIEGPEVGIGAQALRSVSIAIDTDASDAFAFAKAS